MNLFMKTMCKWLPESSSSSSFSIFLICSKFIFRLYSVEGPTLFALLQLLLMSGAIDTSWVTLSLSLSVYVASLFEFFKSGSTGAPLADDEGIPSKRLVYQNCEIIIIALEEF